MKTEIYQYNESPITFQLADGDVMVSATAMAKPFDKRPAKWLELPSTKEFLTALSTIRKSDSERFVLTINGGTKENGKELGSILMSPLSLPVGCRRILPSGVMTA